MKFFEAGAYRGDIDGMRAIAVIAVIFFHAGYLPNGYLGVDMFFVISGYLITGIIYRAIRENRFSIRDFYDRRIRRIIPLVTFISLISLLIGVAVMLPDDLENLAQSVVATSLFSNNILQAVTTRNYWDVVNEYKPLMHTWSLAIEEQYYILYPFLFMLFRKRVKWLLPVIVVLTLISLVLFLMPFEHYEKFYYLPFRFFELSTGGILSILLNRNVIRYKLTPIPVILILLLFYADLSFLPNVLLIILTVLLSGLILISDNTHINISRFLLENPVFVFVGRISFSLYMWHQMLFAFARYFVFEEIHLNETFILTGLTFILSVLTYYFIEQPFRNRHKISIRPIIAGLVISLLVINSGAIYLYLNAGVFKDVPELGISKDKVERNMHAKYNDRVYQMDVPFPDNGKPNVLVLGNSFARDWVNILLESKYAGCVNISYIYDEIKKMDHTNAQAAKADVVFYSEASHKNVDTLELPLEKLWIVGTKNFGFNNGIFYNALRDGYCEQRTRIEQVIADRNEKLKVEWGDRYIDLIALLIDENGKMPVFGDNCQFMSQDCRHLTREGAVTYAAIFNNKVDFVLQKYCPHTSSETLSTGILDIPNY